MITLTPPPSPFVAPDQLEAVAWRAKPSAPPKPAHAPNSDYFPAVVDPDARLKPVERIVKQLAKLEFDAISVAGNSGVSFGAIVAYMLHKPLCIVRKPGESRHSPFEVEGPVGDKYVIIDDTVSSGDTLRRIMGAMTAIKPRAECLGVSLYVYRYDDYKPADYKWFQDFYKVPLL